MSSLTRDGTIETVSRVKILRRERRRGNIILLCSAEHELDWQPYLLPGLIYTLLLYVVMAIHKYIHRYIHNRYIDTYIIHTYSVAPDQRFS